MEVARPLRAAMADLWLVLRPRSACEAAVGGGAEGGPDIHRRGDFQHGNLSPALSPAAAVTALLLLLPEKSRVSYPNTNPAELCRQPCLHSLSCVRLFRCHVVPFGVRDAELCIVGWQVSDEDRQEVLKVLSEKVGISLGPGELSPEMKRLASVQAAQNNPGARPPTAAQIQQTQAAALAAVQAAQGGCSATVQAAHVATAIGAAKVPPKVAPAQPVKKGRKRAPPDEPSPPGPELKGPAAIRPAAMSTVSGQRCTAPLRLLQLLRLNCSVHSPARERDESGDENGANRGREWGKGESGGGGGGGDKD